MEVVHLALQYKTMSRSFALSSIYFCHSYGTFLNPPFNDSTHSLGFLSSSLRLGIISSQTNFFPLMRLLSLHIYIVPAPIICFIFVLHVIFMCGISRYNGDRNNWWAILQPIDQTGPRNRPDSLLKVRKFRQHELLDTNRRLAALWGIVEL
jgi:hypothetical protein